MATIAKSGAPSYCSVDKPPADFPAFFAGEAIAASDPLYLKSDGLAWLATGAAANAAAKVIGQAATAADVGEPVTAIQGGRFHYTTGGTPGARVYLGATAGIYSDAATTGGDVPLGYIMPDGKRIQFFHPNR